MLPDNFLVVTYIMCIALFGVILVAILLYYLVIRKVAPQTLLNDDYDYEPPKVYLNTSQLEGVELEKTPPNGDIYRHGGANSCSCISYTCASKGEMGEVFPARDKRE